MDFPAQPSFHGEVPILRSGQGRVAVWHGRRKRVFEVNTLQLADAHVRVSQATWRGKPATKAVIRAGAS